MVTLSSVLKASTLWADAFYKLICPNVCVSVCLFTFEVPFKRILPPLPEVGFPKFLEIRNPWGKVMEGSQSVTNTFFFDRIGILNIIRFSEVPTHQISNTIRY